MATSTFDGPFIESILWHGLAGLRTITIDEGGGGVDLTLDAPYTLGEALDYWETAANAHGSLANTYAFAQTETAITLGTSPAAAFDVSFSESLAECLGFSAASQTGSTSYTSDVEPMGQHKPHNIKYDAPFTDHEVWERIYRWGRAVTHRHNRAQLSKLVITLDTEDADRLLDGPLLTSRFRAYPYKADTAQEYPNLNSFLGYLDCDPYAVNGVQSYGVADGHTDIELAVVIGASS